MTMKKGDKGPLSWIDRELQQLCRDQLERQPTIRAGQQSASIQLEGRTYCNFGSNDYLGLAADSRLVSAANAATRDDGWGAGASPLVTGRTAHHDNLERALASFESAEAALVFPSGFAANVGTVTALASRSDVIFSDAKNHASLIDGCRQSRAKVVIYSHGDVESLRELIKRYVGFQRRYIVTDSVFSMDGDIAPLEELADVADENGATMIVDEAHATGVLGSHGRGACELLGVESRVPVRIGTLSKALGSIGGFVVGDAKLVHWLFNRARTQVFSTALPSACHAASIAALDIVRNEPQRRQRLADISADVRHALRQQGWSVGGDRTPIIPVVVGDAKRAIELAQGLAEKGCWVPCIRPPSVPAGESLLRISLSAIHDDRDIAGLIDAFALLSS